MGNIISHFQLLFVLGQIGVPFPSPPETQVVETQPQQVQVQPQQVQPSPSVQVPQPSPSVQVPPDSEIESTSPDQQLPENSTPTPSPPVITDQIPEGFGDRIETGVGSFLGKTYVNTIKESEDLAPKFEAAWNGLYAPGSLFSQIQQAMLPLTMIGVALWVFALLKDATEKGFLSDEAKYRFLWLFGVAMLLGNNGVLLGGSIRVLNEIIFSTNEAVLNVSIDNVSNRDNIRAAKLHAELARIRSDLANQCLEKSRHELVQACIDKSGEQALKILEKQHSNIFNQLKAGANGVFRALTEVASAPVDVTGIGVLYSVSAAFHGIIRVSLFIWASSAPIWVAITLFPIKTRGFVIFLTGFWSIGMVIISYTMLQGMIGFFFAVFASSTPTLVAIMSGIFAPIAAIMIAAGSSIALVTGLSAAAAKTVQVAVSGGAKAAAGGV